MATDTGRVAEPLPAELRAMLFGRTAAHAVPDDFRILARIEVAHLLMLVRAGLMTADDARRVLAVIRRFEAEQFRGFSELEPVRGLYLLWERQLTAEAGERPGGSVHLGRSRNDLGATFQRIKLRRPVRRLIRAAVSLNAVLLDQAAAAADVRTAGYTHYQPAQPLTLGHQLAGWSAALGRDVRGVFQAASELGTCPLGAGALAGSALPVDPHYTAALLGFRRPAINSLDAVASRDVVPRLLAASAVLAVTLSRFATDLLLWSTEEFGFLELPDHLVGTSSQMPQKRNPFLIEHAQARGMSAVGAFVTAASRVHGTPFTNSVAVGTESVRPVWDALEDVRQSAVILRHVLAGIRSRPDRMAAAADRPPVLATALAERLAVGGGMPFRRAHHLVGAAVGLAAERGMALPDAIDSLRGPDAAPLDLAGVTAERVVREADQGGGPGTRSLADQLAELGLRHARFVAGLRAMARREASSRRRLRRGCDLLLNAPPDEV